MGKAQREKELFLGDVEQAEEWMDMPEGWKAVGKRQSVSRRTGKPITWVSFRLPDGTVQEFPDFALRREQGKNFQVLTRIFNDRQDEEGPATG